MTAWLEYFDRAGIKHTLEFDGTQKLWIGRRMESSIHSLDETLSREHCWIEYDGAGRRYLLEDNASTGGTYVNGERVDSHVLESGDVIECASLCITFFAERVTRIGTEALNELDGRARTLDAALAAEQRERERLARAHRDAETALEGYREREAKLNAQLDWLESRLSERDQERAEKRAEDMDGLAALRAELTACAARAAEAEHQGRDLARDLEEARDKLAALRKQLDSQAKELARQRKETEEASDKRDQLWAELEAQRKTAEELRAVIDNQETLITTLREAAIEREALLQRLRD